MRLSFCKDSYMKHNQIYHGDNMYYLPDMDDETIDLIYIDPPFGTETLFKSKAFKERVHELKFYDMYGGGKDGYIDFMSERLFHMHRILKPTGSLFVHLDWRMSHYIKIELDKIFGVTNPSSKNTNFINEIIWCYKSGGAGKKHFSQKHDNILFYVKDKKKYLEKFNIEKSEKSYYGPDYSTGNKEVKLYDEKELLECIDEKCSKKKPHKHKVISNKYTLTYPKDWWTDCGIIATSKGNKSKGRSIDNRTGWPTQKPISLLQKIIKHTTKEGDIVADFFCGCGTTVLAAINMNRKWLGIDAGMTACEETQKRINNNFPLFVGNINKKPMTYEDFKRLGRLKFEKAAVRHIGGVTNEKQVADGGVDGRLAYDGTPIQVKKEDKIGDDDKFRGFYMHLKEHGRGIYICLNGYTNPAKQRANQWRREGLDIQLLSIYDVINGNFREKEAA